MPALPYPPGQKGRTLEYLETAGVPVAAYGTDAFPAFFSPDSGHKAPARLDSPTQVNNQPTLGKRLNNGLVQRDGLGKELRQLH